MKRAAWLVAVVLLLAPLTAVGAAHADDPADADGSSGDVEGDSADVAADSSDVGSPVVIRGRLVGPQLPGYTYWAFLDGDAQVNDEGLRGQIGEPVEVSASGAYAFTVTVHSRDSFSVEFAASAGTTPPVRDDPRARAQYNDLEEGPGTTAVIGHHRSRGYTYYETSIDVSPRSGQFVVPVQRFSSISGRLTGAKRFASGEIRLYNVSTKAKGIGEWWFRRLTLNKKASVFAWPLLMYYDDSGHPGVVGKGRKWALCFDSYSRHLHKYQQTCTAGVPWVKTSRWLTATSTHGIRNFALKVPKAKRYY
ncbi:hypothetical protein QT381_11960 [Galbitalea sp. SE-J8]|nr:hypothetical protein [Galbitalea sp. SE-J8]